MSAVVSDVNPVDTSTKVTLESISIVPKDLSEAVTDSSLSDPEAVSNLIPIEFIEALAVTGSIEVLTLNDLT